MFSIKDKIIVVTGASGQLGSAYARALLEHGGIVINLDCKVSESSEENLNEFPDCYLPITLDLTCRERLICALEEIETRFGIPDVLINNAAIDSPPNAPAEENGPFETYPVTSWDNVLEANLKTMFLCCQVFGGAMSANKKTGSIINISSIYGMVAPDQSLYAYRRRRGEEFYKPIAYSVSKSGVLNFSRYLAGYWAKKDIRVNNLTIAGVFNNQEKEFLQAYCDRIPIGRMAVAGDYTGPLIFLASDASRYMTGANLVVDGGWTTI